MTLERIKEKLNISQEEPNETAESILELLRVLARLTIDDYIYKKKRYNINTAPKKKRE